MQLPSYCYFCHTSDLMGGAPRHKPGCKLLRIIDEALATVKKEPEEEEPWTMIRSDDPEFQDARFQRRIIEAHRPIAIVENMHDVTLECGHAPLVFGIPGPKVGDLIFCPDCSGIENL